MFSELTKIKIEEIQKKEIWSFYRASGRPNQKIFAGTESACEEYFVNKDLSFDDYGIIDHQDLYRDNNGYLQIH